MSTVAERLSSQRLADDYSVKPSGLIGPVQVVNFFVTVNTWKQVLPANTGRRFLQIKNGGGNAGYCRVELSVDRENRNATIDIDDFNPRFVPTNALYVYVSDPLNTGSTSVNIQIIEG